MCPMIRPPYESGDEFRYMIVGAIVGWSIGGAIRLITSGGKNSIATTAQRPTKDERQSPAAPDQLR